mgnify:CR=1 FL=1
MRFPEFKGEWENTSLGKIGKTFNGLTGKSGSDFGQGFPYITYKSIFDDSKIDISRVEYVEITDVERKKETQNKVQYGDVFFTTSSETPDEVGMSSVLLDEIKDCYLNSFCFGYRLNSLSKTTPEYMRFYLRSQTIRKKMFVLAQGSTRFNISKSEVMGMSINIPEIEEQRKIANLLTLLDDRIATQNKIIERLETLIKAIGKTLLGESDKYMYLGDLCDIKKGTQINKSALSNKGPYYVMNGGIVPSGYYDLYNTNANTISISEGGNSCGYVQYNYTPFWSGGHCYTLENISPEVDCRYLFHYLKANELEIMSLRIGSGLPNIQKKDLSLFRIPLPTWKNQKTVARSLDLLLYKIVVEQNTLQGHKLQKAYLLQQMFI